MESKSHKLSSPDKANPANQMTDTPKIEGPWPERTINAEATIMRYLFYTHSKIRFWIIRLKGFSLPFYGIAL